MKNTDQQDLQAIEPTMAAPAQATIAHQHFQQLQAQQDLVDANQTYFKLAEFRYEQGVDSYLTRLDAQRSLFSARQGLISTRLAQLSNQVALYKAVGGGWQAPKEASASASQG